MAFIGLMMVGVVLVILGAMFLTTIVLLIIGVCIRKKHKKASKVLFIIAGIIGGLLAAVLLYIFIPKPETIETRDGDAIIYPSWISEYEECLEMSDYNGMRKLIEKHPEMVYYYDVNRVTLLDYGMYNMDVELMQIAIDNGAIFDDPLTYEHLIYENSFESFFERLDYPDWEKKVTHKAGETTDKMIATVEFMLNHGARIEYENAHEYEHQNFYEDAKYWVMEDYDLSDKDKKLLALIEMHMNYRGKRV